MMFFFPKGTSRLTAQMPLSVLGKAGPFRGGFLHINYLSPQGLGGDSVHFASRHIDSDADLHFHCCMC